MKTFFIFTLYLISGLLLVSPVKAKSCGPGFQMFGRECKDENECEDNPNLCGDHSICHNTNGSYYCTCQPGFQSRTPNFNTTDPHCKDINECTENNPCPKNSTCKNSMGSYMCECLPGFKLSTETAACRDIDECDSEEYKCGKHGSCSNLAGSYHCKCNPGYGNYGNNQTKCTDINECTSSNPCTENTTCINTVGSYTCEHLPAFQKPTESPTCTGKTITIPPIYFEMSLFTYRL
ncbi:adhesion G protein-coupled receptor E1-like [Colossoma macropomum]|uniref:adhesion G protein-coupled receptor E1-like n=1 Tax=Colossoma macropomum TaxID=42526 RepID=UPI001864F0F3|nr:adhesion G protein-coupled receptor E1-like [Colossoma macropomum]